MSAESIREDNRAPHGVRPNVLYDRTDATETVSSLAGSAESVAEPENPAARLTLPVLLLAADVTFLVAGGGVAAWVGGIRSAAFIVPVTLLVLLARFQYRWRFTLSVLDDLPMLIAAVGAATLLSAASFAITLTTADNFPDIRIVGGIFAGVVILAFAIAGRMVAYSLVRALRRRRIGVARAVIVGGDHIACRLGDALGRKAELGVQVVGYVDAVSASTGGRVLLGAPGELPGIVGDRRIDLVLIAHGSSAAQRVVDPIRALSAAHCEIFVVPRLYELHDGAVSSDLVDGLPLVQLRRLAFRSPSWRVKRAIDLLAAAIGLILVAPIMLCVAVAVRMETGPGVIYKQQRIGLAGRLFTLYKFCSLKSVEGEDLTTWNIDGDPRIGPVGTFIRSTYLDELPQLLNVLRGQMSLVGPRPERPYFVEEFSATVPGYSYRHRMPVGLTGLAVVNGLRGDTDIHGRANFDNLYVESWSLWLDVKILLRTASQVLPQLRGARTPNKVA